MAEHIPRAMISVNRLLRRRSPFGASDWIMDSGAFSRITGGRGHLPVGEYAAEIRRWRECGNLQAAVAQDWMCEPFVLAVTRLTVRQHQEASTRNYLELREALGGEVHVMPVIQGFEPGEYAEHTRDLSAHLEEGCWAGVGSVCRRQGRPLEVARVLSAILSVRPDLRLHGFGIKATALGDASVALRLHSADSMAWSLAARRERYRDAPQARNSVQACLDWLERTQAIRPRNAAAPLGI